MELPGRDTRYLEIRDPDARLGGSREESHNGPVPSRNDHQPSPYHCLGREVYDFARMRPFTVDGRSQILALRGCRGRGVRECGEREGRRNDFGAAAVEAKDRTC